MTEKPKLKITYPVVNNEVKKFQQCDLMDQSLGLNHMKKQ